MRTGNVLILATCGILVLADWSQPGRFKFGFPFISESVRVARQVPATFSKGRDATLAQVEQAKESIQYEGPAVAAPVKGSCGSPTPATHVGITKAAIAAFVASNPINQQTIEETAKTLGPPLCQVDAYTLRWMEYGSANSLQVTFQQQGDRPLVVGYRYDEQQPAATNTTKL